MYKEWIIISFSSSKWIWNVTFFQGDQYTVRSDDKQFYEYFLRFTS